ncbi:TetR/AcrR family transcriptional regulator [Vibrio breoganii]|uniref:TetR/AcrR family transcriptional regulator n=1 Tax=Vibrio breoganii TaxID=553239 RepID=UPI000C81856F|nr:TetR/AcrR family transcriptional regulator [Vibrio breoganii]PML24191.1 TetR family transcriptional regulator [Vibrio breoganii]
MVKDEIAGRLEIAFSQHGFAQMSVAELKIASGVSLRTLYRYYPSKESMVIGALEHRHQRYIAYLDDESFASGTDSIIALIDALGCWMSEDAPNGCLSMNAFSAFPNNDEVNAAVQQHKEQLVQLLAQRSARPDLAMALFLIHEGVSLAWPTMGEHAIVAAKDMVRKLLK